MISPYEELSSLFLENKTIYNAALFPSQHWICYFGFIWQQPVLDIDIRGNIYEFRANIFFVFCVKDAGKSQGQAASAVKNWKYLY